MLNDTHIDGHKMESWILTIIVMLPNNTNKNISYILELT